MARGKFDGTSINFDHSNGKGGVFGTTFFCCKRSKKFQFKAKTSRGDMNSISKLIEFEKWTKGSAGKVLIVQASSAKLRQGVTKYNLHT